MPTIHWFEYRVRAQPHHTDFGGIVWHGHYIAWLEAARVEVLRKADMPFESFLAADINLVVADLNLRYRRPLPMGADAVVLARPLSPTGIRLPWDYEIHSPERDTLYLTSNLHLAPVNGAGVLYRRLPVKLLQAYERMQDLLADANVALN
jgi:acyl-CoA thioester hydrolase